MDRATPLLSPLLVVLPGLGLVGLAVTSIHAESSLLQERERTRMDRLARRSAQEVRRRVQETTAARHERLREALRRGSDLAAVGSGVLVVDEAGSQVFPPSPFAETGPAVPPAGLRAALQREATDPAAALADLPSQASPWTLHLRARLLLRLGRHAEARAADEALFTHPRASARLRRVALARQVASLEAAGEPTEAARQRLVAFLLTTGGRGDTPEAVWAALRDASNPAARHLAAQARTAALLRALGDPSQARLPTLGPFALVGDGDAGWLVIGPQVRHAAGALRVVLPCPRAQLDAHLRAALGPDPEYPVRLVPPGVSKLHEPLGPGRAVMVFADPDALTAVATRSRLLLLLGLLAVVAIGGAVTLRSLRRTAELARLRADFVASVTHELRTPLASIRSLADVLALGKVDPAEQPAFLEGIATEARRLSRLVDDVLDVARIERGAFVAELEPGRVDDLIVEGVEVVRPLAEEQGYALELEPLPELPRLLVDRVLFARALENLLLNAVKYSQGARRITVRAALEDGGLALTVADAGVGIPPSEREAVFERFVRGAGVDGQTGAGLGLAIVREIMSAHQGRVSLRCPPGGGCRFTLHLPAWVDAEPQDATPKTELNQ